MEEIKLIKDIVAAPNADTISNRLMNAQVELNVTRNFLSDASNFCTDDYDMGLSCKMILRKHIEYLRCKVEMLRRMHARLQDDMCGGSLGETDESTSVSREPGTKKEVPCCTNSDNVDMLI